MNMTEAMREQFEAWAKAHGMSVNTYKSIPYYLEEDTQLAWDAYQAALRSPAVAGMAEALQDILDTGFTKGPQGKRALAVLAQYATLVGESR